MQLYARHGDLVFDKLDTPITGDLDKHVDLILAGNDSAPHTVRGQVEARREEGITFLRVAKATTVDHAGRHMPITLEPGDYEVRPLRERHDGADRAVED